MKATAFTEIHRKLGAKMVPFAGFEMPVLYTGINHEHETVRNSVGVFDVSHMGEFIVKGANAIDLLQYMTSNDVSKLATGQAQYSCLPNGNGGIVDDILVYRMEEQTYMLVVNAANISKDWDWISKHNNFGAEMRNVSDETSLLAVQGPKATGVLQPLTDYELKSIPYYHFVKTRFCGADDVIISATGYTGAGGYELFFDNRHAGLIWEKIFEAGKSFGIKPVGLGARDTLRLEMGFCLYGNDIDDTTSPLEAGLGWITKFTKKFIDSDNLLAQKKGGVSRKLCGFEMKDKAIPRHGYDILSQDGKNIIGKVTSGTMSPTLKKGIGLGYVSNESSAPGIQININIRGIHAPSLIVKAPFLQKVSEPV